MPNARSKTAAKAAAHAAWVDKVRAANAAKADAARIAAEKAQADKAAAVAREAGSGEGGRRQGSRPRKPPLPLRPSARIAARQ